MVAGQAFLVAIIVNAGTVVLVVFNRCANGATRVAGARADRRGTDP